MLETIFHRVKNTQDNHNNNNDNNLFIQVEEESLAVKNTGTEGDLMTLSEI